MEAHHYQVDPSPQKDEYPQVAGQSRGSQLERRQQITGGTTTTTAVYQNLG